MLSILLQIFSYNKYQKFSAGVWNVLQIYGIIIDPYLKLILIYDQFNRPLEVYVWVAHLLSANVGLWPAEVILSQWDFVFPLFWECLQVKLPIKSKTMLPTKISHGCNNVPSLNWTLSSLVCRLPVIRLHPDNSASWLQHTPFVKLCFTILLISSSSL